MYRQAKVLFLFLFVSAVFCSSAFGTVAEPDWTVHIGDNTFGLQQYALYDANGKPEQCSTVVCYGPGRFTVSLPLYGVMAIGIAGLMLICGGFYRHRKSKSAKPE